GEVPREDRGLALDLARRLLCDVAVDVVDQHLRTLAHEQLRGGAADPACGAGDDRGLAVEKSHVSPNLLPKTFVNGGTLSRSGVARRQVVTATVRSRAAGSRWCPRRSG